MMVLVASWTAHPAAALEPAEVLVVANADVEASVELASYYMEQRGIPEENLVLIHTVAEADVSPFDYETFIRLPIQKALIAHEQDPPIRAICLMWGVPVRITETAKDADGMSEFLVQQADRSQRRLAIDLELIGKVGKDNTPPTKANSLTISDNFSALPPEPKAILPVNALVAASNQKFKEAKITVNSLTGNKRLVAVQKMMAMEMEVNGLRGLITYIETIYGDSDALDKATLAKYKRYLTDLEAKLEAIDDEPLTRENIEKRLAYLQWSDGTIAVTQYAESLARLRRHKEGARASASVDSELAVLWCEPLTHAGEDGNPLYWDKPRSQAYTALFTSRIDGPTAEDARNLLDRSMAAEAEGLEGKFYVDSGMPTRFADKPGGYQSFVTLLDNMAASIDEKVEMDVVVDKEPDLFPAGQEDGALYVGWYKLKSYSHRIEWTPGAVAYHVASLEATDLRNPKSNQWCGRLIQKGVGATIGAVDEPFLGQFPDHEAFFTLLLTGDYTIAECYWRAIPGTSWRMTLIADPLYNPFKNNPQIDATTLSERLLPDEDWQPLPEQHIKDKFSPDDDEEETSDSDVTDTTDVATITEAFDDHTEEASVIDSPDDTEPTDD